MIFIMTFQKLKESTLKLISLHNAETTFLWISKKKREFLSFSASPTLYLFIFIQEQSYSHSEQTTKSISIRITWIIFLQTFTFLWFPSKLHLIIIRLKSNRSSRYLHSKTRIFSEYNPESRPFSENGFKTSSHSTKLPF